MFSMLNLENKKLAFKYLQELRLIPGPMMDRLMQAVVSRKSNWKMANKFKFTLLKMEELCQARLMLKSLWMEFLQPVWLYLQKTWKQLSLTMHRKLVKSPWIINAREHWSMLTIQKMTREIVIRSMIRSKIWIWQMLWSMSWRLPFQVTWRTTVRVLKRMNLGMQRRVWKPS